MATQSVEPVAPLEQHVQHAQDVPSSTVAAAISTFGTQPGARQPVFPCSCEECALLGYLPGLDDLREVELARIRPWGTRRPSETSWARLSEATDLLSTIFRFLQLRELMAMYVLVLPPLFPLLSVLFYPSYLVPTFQPRTPSHPSSLIPPFLLRSLPSQLSMRLPCLLAGISQRWHVEGDSLEDVGHPDGCYPGTGDAGRGVLFGTSRGREGEREERNEGEARV